MGLITGVARDQAGNVVASATVTVYLTGTLTLASLFSDKTLTSPAANPVTVDANGVFYVFVADGNYDVVLSKVGLPSETVLCYPVFDPANYALLSGRAGGQTLTGDPAAAGLLLLRGSSHATPGTVRIDDSALVFNEDGADRDARFEGDTNPALLFLDASADRVGVRTATPLTVLHVSHASTVPAGELGSLLVTGASASERLAFGYETGVGAWIQSVLNGVAASPLRLNPGGGGLLVEVHNVAAGAGAGQAVASGTYTPVYTNVANLAASTARIAQWIRVGSVVSVSGEFDGDPTAGSTLTQVGISLPIASNLASAFQCAGTSVMDPGSVSMSSGRIKGDTVNDRAQIDYYSDAGAANRTISWSFQYVVV